MLSIEDIDSGLQVTHKNTGLRYTVVEFGEEEVLLAPEKEGFQDLIAPMELFLQEFISADRYSTNRVRRGGRGRGRGAQARPPTGPKARGRIKKMVRDRGFGFIRGDDGKEVFFHRSGLNAGDYDALNEGDSVEYVIQEGPRGARAENVRAVSATAEVTAPASDAAAT